MIKNFCSGGRTEGTGADIPAGGTGEKSPAIFYSRQKHCPVVCVTGPMAAGKNAAADILAARGWACVDADMVNRSVLQQMTLQLVELHQPAAARLGLSLLQPDGSLNRAAIARIVFADPEALHAHEALLHPVIDRKLNEFIDSHPDVPVVLNATVLYKTPVINRCNIILFVDAPCVIRFIRARHRDHMSFRQISARFRSQKHIFTKYKNSNADIYRVWNIGSPCALERKIERMLILWNRNGYCGLLQQ